jgi:hypothetical protein
MALPYVIRIFVVDGDPDGVRIVEKSNWSGQGVVFARSDLASARGSGVSSPGVYILLGEDLESGFEGTVYVGEAEDVGKRLVTHSNDDGKDFWTWTAAFTSKDDTLNKAHIRYLESRLIKLAEEARRFKVANSTSPSPPPMSAADMAEAEGFLFEMLAVLPTLGVAAFDRPTQQGSREDRYFLRGVDADGEGRDGSDGFVVFAGATARVEETASIGAGFKKRRAQLVDTGLFQLDGGVYRLVEDTLFTSPTTAACVLLGRQANGRTEWKDINGITLKENQASAAKAADNFNGDAVQP